MFEWVGRLGSEETCTGGSSAINGVTNSTAEVETFFAMRLTTNICVNNLPCGEEERKVTAEGAEASYGMIEGIMNFSTDVDGRCLDERVALVHPKSKD